MQLRTPVAGRAFAAHSRRDASDCSAVDGTGVASRDRRSEFQYPTPDGFIGDVEPPLGEELLDIAITQREAQVEPDRMLDDHRRKAMATVRNFSYRASLSSASLPGYPVNLTKPERYLPLLGQAETELEAAHDDEAVEAPSPSF